MFTLEIKGRPIAVVVADEAQARELFDDEDFKEDLRSMESEGEPLWNGTDALEVRPASPDERQAAQESLEEDEEQVEGELTVLFMVTLDDEDEWDDEEEDEEEEGADGTAR
jgi:hypothetical protein